MGWAFLLVSLWGAAFTLNAFFPTRVTERTITKVAQIPSFFASWLTIELAELHLLWQALVTGVFLASGALESLPGRVGLAVTAASWGGLFVLMQRARATSRQLSSALGGHLPKEPVPAARRRRSVRRLRNVAFRRVDGKTLRLDVFLPEGAGAEGDTQRRPAIVQIHGGGWVIGDKREQGIPLLKHLAAHGWVGFNVNYRLSPGATFPDHLVDVKAAIAWVRAHADEYGVDPTFVAVTGGSAGGHLAALAALTANERKYQPGFPDADTSVQAAAPFYGVYDITNRLGTWPAETVARFFEPVVMKAFLAEEPHKFRSASPFDLVRVDAPPFFVLHGDRDTLAPVEDAREFVTRLRRVSASPVLYAELEGAQHAFDIFHSTRASYAVMAVERFLTMCYRRHQAPPDVDLTADVASPAELTETKVDTTSASDGHQVDGHEDELAADARARLLEDLVDEEIVATLTAEAEELAAGAATDAPPASQSGELRPF